MTCQHCRDEIDTLKEQIRQLQEVIGVTDHPAYGLSDGEWQLIGPLFRKLKTPQVPIMSHDQMRSVYAARSRDKDAVTDGTIRVLISKARHKLKPHGYEIQPIYGRGYELVQRKTA